MLRAWKISGRYYFNPRSREGSDEDICFSLSIVHKFQSSLPRGERHQSNQRKSRSGDISILAPARGATFRLFSIYCQYKVNFNPRSREGSDSHPGELRGFNRFQSSLPRGERHCYIRSIQRHNYFNPRSREGSDRDNRIINFPGVFISILAPARGATRDPAHKRE